MGNGITNNKTYYITETTSNMKIFTARQTTRQPRPRFRPTLLTILEEGEIHGHHMEVKLILEIEWMINKILDNYSSPPHMYPSFYSFLDEFLWTVDEHTTQILNDCFISWTNMLNPSHNTSSLWHSPSYQFPEWTIDTTIHREDAGITITMLGGDPVSFAEYCFLGYLC